MRSISDHIKPILALIIIIGGLVYLFTITLIQKDDSNIQSQALIAVVSILSSTVSYYYGYSQGASKKDETMSNMAKNNKNAKDETTPD